MNQRTVEFSRPKGLLERVEGQFGAHRFRRSPTDDHLRKDVGDERDEYEACPGRHISEVGNPELVRPRRGEVSLHKVQRPRIVIVGDRRPLRLAADNSLQPH